MKKHFQLQLTRSNICFLLSSLLFFISCKKDNQPKDKIPVSDYVKFSAVAMEFVKLPEDGYYIYKDSATGLTDSVIVTESKLEKKYSPADSYIFFGSIIYIPAAYYETFSLSLQLTDPTGNTIDWLRCADSNKYKIFDLYQRVDSSINMAPYFWYPVKSPYDYKYQHTDILSSVTIEGTSFKNVLRFYTKYENPNDPYGMLFNYYWVKGIGIIKREVRKNNISKTELLVRYGRR